MITGIHISTALFFIPPVFLPQTPDYVERERERERESLSAAEVEEELETRGQGEREKGTRDEGRL
jgi:hypothetical protein